MKRILFTLAIMASACCAQSQTTYYWVGGAGPSSFTSNASWNTALDGSGTARVAAAATDILIFDGTNIGGAIPATGTVSTTTGTTSFAQLKLQNNATVIIQRSTVGGTSTVTIAGDPSGDDLIIPAGSSLTINVSENTASNVFALSATATGKINGTLTITGGGSRLTAANPVAGGAVFFEAGAVCNVNTVLASQYPFGSTAGAARAIVFKSGSTLLYQGGNSFFSNTSTNIPIVFQNGSTCNFAAAVPSTNSTSSNFFSTRYYANVIISGAASVLADAFYNIDTLTIQPASSFTLKLTGVSPVSGNIVNNGTFGAATPISSSALLFKGIVPQSISGTGTFNQLGALSVATDANLTLNTNLVLNGTSTSTISGILNAQNYTISGTGDFQTRPAATATTTVTSGPAGTNTLVLDAAAYATGINTANVATGLLAMGTGIPPNTYIIGTNSATSSIVISNAATAIVNSVTIIGNAPTFITANAGGADGSIATTGARSFGSTTNYIFNTATTAPFSLASGNTTGNVTFNAAATTNRVQQIGGVLTLNAGNLTIRPVDTIRLTSTGTIAGGPFSAAKYIVTDVAGANVGVLRMDGFTTARLFPVGNVSNYLPVTLTPTSAMDFGVSVFTGITEDGTVTGTAFTPIKKSGVVDAVWNLARITGTGDCSIDVNWPAGLEGTAFSTFADAEIGIGHHDGVNWGLVIGSGNNSSNTASAVFSTFSPFAVGRAGTLLPVKLLNTSAMVINNNVTVQWDAQNETDISYYRIQRSGDGVHFSNTGTITARNNLALINQYSYTDAGLAAGIYFYRLVSIGKNNNSSYSNIMRVAVQVKISVNAYPNPVTEVLNISGIQKDDLLKLININGAVVRTSTAAGNTGTIDVQQLPTGNYTLQVYRSTTVLTSVTVIKN